MLFHFEKLTLSTCGGVLYFVYTAMQHKPSPRGLTSREAECFLRSDFKIHCQDWYYYLTVFPSGPSLSSWI